MKQFSLLNSYPFDRKVVKKLMIDLDLTVGDLVKRIPGLSQATISRYTNGVGRNPLIQQALADAFGVPLDTLYAQPSIIPTTPKPRRRNSNGTITTSSPSLAAAGRE